MRFIVALAQMAPFLGDVKKNIGKHCEYIDKAVGGGADLVVFPELSLTGYTLRDINWDLALNPFTSDLFRELKQRSKDISIILGAVEESSAYGIHNSAILIEDGEAKFTHRKVYPPTYGMFEELRYFSPSRSVQAVDSRIGRLGILVCEDLWHISLPYLLAQDGAEFIVAIAASPTRLTGSQNPPSNYLVNSQHHQAYARLLSCYIVFCNRVGFEDGVSFWGGSEVISPDGSILITAKFFDEDLVFAEVDANELRRARRFSRHTLDEDPNLVLREMKRILKQ
jgi:predicted amidohydrolase